MVWPHLVIEYLDHVRSATPHVEWARNALGVTYTLGAAACQGSAAPCFGCAGPTASAAAARSEGL